MYFLQSDLLEGMSRDFVKGFMAISEKVSLEPGEFLFQEGDPAAYFWILLKGRVKLSIGETSHTVYSIGHPGEAFGWSSLVDRPVYSASAECRLQTKVLRIEVRKLHDILMKDPVQGAHFFKKLAAVLGKRLLWSYQIVDTLQPMMEGSSSFGSRTALGTEISIP
ncbi:MAG: cyclic nucleotide-binding domain-containing protein [Desulfatiglandaceae bacterium]